MVPNELHRSILDQPGWSVRLTMPGNADYIVVSRVLNRSETSSTSIPVYSNRLLISRRILQKTFAVPLLMGKRLRLGLLGVEWRALDVLNALPIKAAG